MVDPGALRCFSKQASLQAAMSGSTVWKMELQAVLLSCNRRRLAGGGAKGLVSASRLQLQQIAPVRRVGSRGVVQAGI